VGGVIYERVVWFLVLSVKSGSNIQKIDDCVQNMDMIMITFSSLVSPVLSPEMSYGKNSFVQYKIKCRWRR